MDIFSFLESSLETFQRPQLEGIAQRIGPLFVPNLPKHYEFSGCAQAFDLVVSCPVILQCHPR